MSDKVKDLLSSILNDEEFIEHYGVKGMRWGVRKDRSSGSSFLKRKKDQYGTDGPSWKERRERSAGKSFITKKKEQYERATERRKPYNDAKKAGKQAIAKKVKDAAKKATEDKSSEDAKKAKETRKKRLNEMSNDELAALNKRLQLERSYRDLNPSAVNKGKKAVSGIIGQAGKEAVKNRLVKTIDKGIDLGIAAILDDKKGR